jgi:hypothetical protein
MFAVGMANDVSFSHLANLNFRQEGIAYYKHLQTVSLDQPRVA